MRLLKVWSQPVWLTGVSLVAAACFALSIWFAHAERVRTRDVATRSMESLADSSARQIEADIAVFDLALRDVALRSQSTATPRSPLLDVPVLAKYVTFINALNEAGDVIADPRGVVTHPGNYAGRDYFQDHLKNPADVLTVGRPYSTAPTQHAAIPLSRRLTRPDGGFGGVIVAGVQIAWLGDRVAAVSPGFAISITMRRDDGLALSRVPEDPEAVGRSAANDPIWQRWSRDGTSPVTRPSGDVSLYRRIAGLPLVLEYTLAPDDFVANHWLTAVSALSLIPAACVVALSLLVWGLRRRAEWVEAAARAADEDRIQLLGDMSHELRTPLSAVLNQAELIARRGGLPLGQKAGLDQLIDAAMMARAVVTRVINLARPEDAAATPDRIACDLDELVRGCLGMVQLEADEKGVVLRGEVSLTTPRHVMLAGDHVRLVLVNLLTNAVKYTNRGSVALRVSGDTARLRFEIVDTGPGIAPDKRHRLFGRYDRIDRSDANGTGLGLSLAHRFVRLMGGQIDHWDNLGGGSVFCVELPTAGASPTAPAAEDAPMMPVRPLRLLLADDLALTRDATAALLREAGHDVIDVDGGEAALAELRKRAFDVVLTDLRMPDMDGLRVARSIRALPGARGRTPILVVTADQNGPRKIAANPDLANLCLTRPFTRAELLAAVAAAVGLNPIDPEPRDAPDLDVDPLAELRQSLGADAFVVQMSTALGRVEGLTTLLEGPNAEDDPEVGEAIHDMIGIAGLFGLTALSLSLRRFDVGQDRDLAHLRAAAVSAASSLRAWLADSPDRVH
jgi:signal transduction histidine kinase/CheY-like chemotaxis protein